MTQNPYWQQDKQNQQAQNRQQTREPSTPFAGMALAMAYPTFVLIWFSRPRVAQHIRTWTN